MSDQHSDSQVAFGAPGIEPRWTRSDKDAIVTAYSASSPIWASISAGVINEVYYPYIDSPQIRDLQFLITDGETFFHDERRGAESEIERQCPDSLWFRVVNRDREGRYRIEKEVITAPHAACLLIKTRVVVEPEWQGRIRIFALLAPHLKIGGQHNSGQLETQHGRLLMCAHRDNHWLALDCSQGFLRGSCGYVGSSDGWTDLNQNKQLDWEFARADDGNIALTGEIDLSAGGEFTLALGFGSNRHNALTATVESLAIPFEKQVERFRDQWRRACEYRYNDLAQHSHDDGYLLRTSHNMLLAHEDKTCHGAMIASLSIPWGEAKNDEDLGGYHLVWPRDLVNSATGLMAAGETGTPFRALMYLAASQLDDGGFYQNFWIDGRPYWHGVQLDEVAFPILLAWRLKQAGALEQFDPYPMVRAAACYLVCKGPATPQERWEENSGYSPSTLAAHIAALICASAYASERGEDRLATYWAEYADFLQQHLKRWCVTESGTLLPGTPRHFIRLLPVDCSDPHAAEDPETAMIAIKNRWDQPNVFPAKDVVDGGFLELVRYGVMKAGDPLIEDSLRVIDHALKVETPFGPCWRRYNHDGYGQRDDGGPFTGTGRGRAWPLLTGERGHYELAAGRSAAKYIKAIEGFSGPTGLLPEQVWDAADLPAERMEVGRPTGSAMPLMWAHAEYIKLLRSTHDGRLFDRIDVVYERYCESAPPRTAWEIWKFQRQPASLRPGETLRIQTEASFRLRWSADGWETYSDLDCQSPGDAIYYADLSPAMIGDRAVDFTFYWIDAQKWEGANFRVVVD